VYVPCALLCDLWHSFVLDFVCCSAVDSAHLYLGFITLCDNSIRAISRCSLGFPFKQTTLSRFIHYTRFVLSLMSSLLKAHEADLRRLLGSLATNIDKLNHATAASSRQVVQVCEKDLEEAFDVLERMEFEVRSLPSSEKVSVNARLKSFRADLDSHRRKIRRAEDASFGRRDSGLSGATANSVQERFARSTSKLVEGKDRLSEARKIAAQTEEVGQGIMGELQSQRETLIHARDEVHGVNDNLTRGQGLLRTMTRRAVMQKVMLWCVVLILVVIIIIVAANRFAGDNDVQASDSPGESPTP